MKEEETTTTTQADEVKERKIGEEKRPRSKRRKTRYKGRHSSIGDRKSREQGKGMDGGGGGISEKKKIKKKKRTEETEKREETKTHKKET